MAKKTKSKAHSRQPTLPLPAPAKVTRADKLHFNQLVTLKSDKTFRGHVFARAASTERGPEYFISIKEPGRTGKRGCKAFPVDDVIAVTGDEKDGEA
jgi:hypothetical protein